MQRQKKLTESIEIRVSPQDKARVVQHAKEAGMKMSDYIRRRLMLDRATPQETVR